jgi:hypothetical protein
MNAPLMTPSPSGVPTSACRTMSGARPRRRAAARSVSAGSVREEELLVGKAGALPPDGPRNLLPAKREVVDA